MWSAVKINNYETTRMNLVNVNFFLGFFKRPLVYQYITHSIPHSVYYALLSARRFLPGRSFSDDGYCTRGNNERKKDLGTYPFVKAKRSMFIPRRAKHG